MTNGEMIQKVFNCEVCEPIIEDDIIHVIFADKKDSAIGFDWSWWNAEYKEPTTKNVLGVDTVLRADARKAIIDHQYSDSFCEEHNIDHSINTGMALIALSNLPSVTPQLSSELGKKLEKNFGELDCISRQAVLELIADYDLSMGQVVRGIHTLPSVTPQEPILDKIKDQIKDYLRGVEITLEVLVENDPLRPKMEGAKDTLEECLNLIGKAEAEVEHDE